MITRGRTVPAQRRTIQAQSPDPLVHGLSSLGLGKMLAVRGGPQQAHRAAAGDFERVHIPHAGLIVYGVRVVGLVH